MLRLGDEREVGFPLWWRHWFPPNRLQLRHSLVGPKPMVFSEPTGKGRLSGGVNCVHSDCTCCHSPQRHTQLDDEKKLFLPFMKTTEVTCITAAPVTYPGNQLCSVEGRPISVRLEALYTVSVSCTYP